MKCTCYPLLKIWVFVFVPFLVQAQQAHPDNVYPIPNNYGEVNNSGINLFTGDLNLGFSLASISGKSLNYNLTAFYNSRSIMVTPDVDNTLGGKGWKLMDYPKIVQDGNAYYYLDGKISHELQLSGSNLYITGGNYYLWKFELNDSGWTITTGTGNQYVLENHYDKNSMTFWNLSRINDLNWDDWIDFTYTAEKLNTLTNSLGDALELQYNGSGQLVQIDIYQDRTADGRIKDRILLNYESSGLANIGNSHNMNNGFVNNATAPLEFNYDANGRMYQVISPSGGVQSYVHYIGGQHNNLEGSVIQYSSDDGYTNTTNDTDGTAYQADPTATYSAIWYDLDNALIGDQDIYYQYNKVRVYPGGFCTDDPQNCSYREDLKNPFGHQVYYFFNGNAGEYLADLPEDYRDSTNVMAAALRGVVYQTGQYSDQSLEEDPSDQIAQHQSIYELEYFGHDESVRVSFAQLQKTYDSRDGADTVVTWYDYYDASDYYLLQSVTYDRSNPKIEDPDYREFEKQSIRYAFQDYTTLETDYILAAQSQSWTTVTAYSGDVEPDDQNLNWEVTDAWISVWKDWSMSGGIGYQWAPYENYTLIEELPDSALPVINISASISPDQWLKTGEMLSRNQYGLSVLSENVDELQNSITYDESYGFYPVSSFANANVTNEEAAYYGFESYESSDPWNISGGAITKSDARTGIQSYGGNQAISVRTANYSPKAESAYVFGAFIKNEGGSVGTIGFKKGASWSTSQSIPKDSTEWQYISVVDTTPSTSEVPTIECTDCLIDDIRFHPVDALFSASVYRDQKVEDDTLTVDKPGIYQANNTVNVENINLVSGESLQIRAGETIRFAPESSIAVGAMASIRLGDYSTDMNTVTATLGVNGEVYQQVYGVKDDPIGIVGPNKELRDLNVSYTSRGRHGNVWQ